VDPFLAPVERLAVDLRAPVERLAVERFAVDFLAVDFLPRAAALVFLAVDRADLPVDLAPRLAVDAVVRAERAAVFAVDLAPLRAVRAVDFARPVARLARDLARLVARFAVDFARPVDRFADERAPVVARFARVCAFLARDDARVAVLRPRVASRCTALAASSRACSTRSVTEPAAPRAASAAASTAPTAASPALRRGVSSRIASSLCRWGVLQDPTHMHESYRTQNDE
jgi:hypothetical protein